MSSEANHLTSRWLCCMKLCCHYSQASWLHVTFSLLFVRIRYFRYIDTLNTCKILMLFHLQHRMFEIARVHLYSLQLCLIPDFRSPRKANKMLSTCYLYHNGNICFSYRGYQLTRYIFKKNPAKLEHMCVNAHPRSRCDLQDFTIKINRKNLFVVSVISLKHPFNKV